MRRRADAAGWLRFALPAELGGQDGTNYEMATIRDHLAAKGLGLHNDLQNEASVVGNLVFPLLLQRFGTPEQREQFLETSITGEVELAFALTEPEHGSDATWMSTRAERDGDDWVITGAKTLDLQRPPGRSRAGVRPHLRPRRRRRGPDGVLRADRRSRLRRAVLPVDVQHADRSRRVRPRPRPCPGRGRARRGGPRPRRHARLRQREPHPAGRQRHWGRAVLHRAVRRLRPRAGHLRSAPGPAPGRAVPARRAARRLRADPDLSARHGRPPRRRRVRGRPGVAVQLPRQPAGLRGRRPGDAGPRWDGLQPASAVRAHLPPPPSLPHHRGSGGDPDPHGGRPPVRIRAIHLSKEDGNEA